jgi:tRNA threonylcarbamoyladenosine biosynthesis protein TsaE
MDNLSSSRIICKNESDLIGAAESLLAKYSSQRFFAFYGEMGAGKTTFIKAICSLVGCIDIVNSPTFSIINVYKTKDFSQIFHFDLYRLNSLGEVYDIGYEDYFYSNSYCFIEWPEKIESLLPDFHVKVFMDVNPTDGSRLIRF